MLLLSSQYQGPGFFAVTSLLDGEVAVVAEEVRLRDLGLEALIDGVCAISVLPGPLSW